MEPIGQEEGLLDTIAMVHIDIDVNDTRIGS
jgi:hypothetical protein